MKGSMSNYLAIQSLLPLFFYNEIILGLLVCIHGMSKLFNY